jgi:enoyl-CoA hydratase/carnithine racemase
VRVLVLTGRGKGFCSGGDVHEIIGELQKRDVKGMLEFTRMTGAVVRNLRLIEKPVVAAINGIAAGAGSVLALASDFRIMADTARFAFLFTKVGLTGADMGAAFLLPKVVGFGRATELLMLGDTIDAATAERYAVTHRWSRPTGSPRDGRAQPAAGRRSRPGPGNDQAHAQQRVGHGSRLGDRGRSAGAGAPADGGGPQGVLPRLHREAPPRFTGR